MMVPADLNSDLWIPRLFPKETSPKIDQLDANSKSDAVQIRTRTPRESKNKKAETMKVVDDEKKHKGETTKSGTYARALASIAGVATECGGTVCCYSQKSSPAQSPKIGREGGGCSRKGRFSLVSRVRTYLCARSRLPPARTRVGR